ncbi:MAG TPA: hypothetical protein VN577_03385 [Terriglobales bacterium]|nr:hypothetical protein [Terriglobales bacterium]
MSFDPRLNHAWWVLKIGLGLAPILAGLDKFTNILANWEMYLNPLAPRILHVQPTTFMHVVGVIEIVAGIIVLSQFTRYGAYLVMAWLIGIALNLVTQGMFFDIAVRDIEMSLGAFALAKLTEAREAVSYLSGTRTTPRPVETRSIA